MGADTKATTFGGSGALEVGDHRLLEASAEAPLSPTSLSRILRGKMGGGSGERAGGCQQALTRTEYSGAARTPGS